MFSNVTAGHRLAPPIYCKICEHLCPLETARFVYTCRRTGIPYRYGAVTGTVR